MRCLFVTLLALMWMGIAAMQSAPLPAQLESHEIAADDLIVDVRVDGCGPAARQDAPTEIRRSDRNSHAHGQQAEHQYSRWLADYERDDSRREPATQRIDAGMAPTAQEHAPVFQERDHATCDRSL